jgi:hypothetical protein
VVARKTEVCASAKSESGPWTEEQESVAEGKLMDRLVMECGPCRCRYDLWSRKLHDSAVQDRRTGEGRHHAVYRTSRFAVATEEVTEGMANGVANAPG